MAAQSRAPLPLASVAAGLTADGYTNSALRVLECGHQFHRGCVFTWWRGRSDCACPICKDKE